MSTSKHDFNSYFIASNVQSAVDIVDAIKAESVSENDIGTVSRDPQFKVAELPQADLSDKSKLPEALKRGALLGSGSGLLAGLLLTSFPVAGVTVGGAAILAMTAGGAALGSWSAGMIGVSENSELVQQLEDALENKKTIIFTNISDAEKERILMKLQPIAAAGELEFGKI